MKRLEGKVAIITGAASGQGAAEAKLFAQQGAKVVATDLNEDSLTKVVEEIILSGGDAIAIKHDVSNEEQWKSVVQEAVTKFGKVDVLVNNAGIHNSRAQKSIEDLTTEDWDMYLNINLNSAFYGIKYVTPEMKKVGRGSIINVSSMNGIYATRGVGANYSTAKGGMRMMSKVAANDLGEFNIRSNSIHPGFIMTPMAKQVTSNKEIYNAFVSNLPLRRGGKPEEVAYLALFLASEESSFITGQELIIDGGQTCKM